MLEIKNLEKTYHAIRYQKALDGVSLTVAPGEIVGLFGENGAGKTTFLKCILQLLQYTGSVTLDGVPVTHANIERLSFATCEHSFFPNLTAQSHRDFYKMHFPRWREKRFQALLEFFELPGNKALRHFSTGQKNQFEVILALSQGADYILTRATTSSIGRIFIKSCWAFWNPTKPLFSPPICWRRWNTLSAARRCCGRGSW